MKYNLVTVEGNIGAGKTTLARKLAEEFDARLVLEEFENNPFLPPFIQGQKSKAFPTELYFMAERFQQLQQEIRSYDLFQDRILMDYLFNKSLLFARVNLEGDEYELFKKLFTIINPQLPQPELLIYVHSEVDRIVRNIHQRGRDFEDGVDPEYLQRLQDMYFAFFKQQPDMRILVLDCTEADFVANEEHYREIVEIVSAEYETGTHSFKIG